MSKLKLIVIETTKLFAFSLAVYLFVSYSERRNEIVANQFLLSESFSFYHNKSYKNINSNSICALYSQQLGNFLDLFIIVHSYCF